MAVYAVDTVDRVGLLGLLELAERLHRSADLAELLFVLVNGLRSVCEYRTAVLIERDHLRGKIRAISGVALVDRQAPFARWLEQLAAQLLTAVPLRVVERDHLPAALRTDWDEWLPAQVVWVPLQFRGEAALRGGLLLARESGVWAPEMPLLSLISGWYSAALLAHSRRFGRRGLWGLRPTEPWSYVIRFGILAGLVALLLLPVRINIVAPAEVAPADPVVVRAPLDGVVSALAVKPNQPVRPGQLLMSLDKEDLMHRLAVARQSYEVAAAQLEQDRKKALLGENERFNLGVLERVLARHDAEINYLKSLLARADVVAPAAGRVIFEDEVEWLGRPVRLGEKIMLVADPALVVLEVEVPVGDMILLPAAAVVVFYLNVAPGDPVYARVERVSYQASQTEDNVLAYRVRARLTAPADLRIGLQGLAKIYGHEATLIGYVLRRPLTYVRQQFERFRL